jgi:hypothetical protein
MSETSHMYCWARNKSKHVNVEVYFKYIQNQQTRIILQTVLFIISNHQINVKDGLS